MYHALYFTYITLPISHGIYEVAANILGALHKLAQLPLPQSGILGLEFRSIWLSDLDESSTLLWSKKFSFPTLSQRYSSD